VKVAIICRCTLGAANLWLGISIQGLFGQFCSSTSFSHDIIMAGYAEKVKSQQDMKESQTSETSSQTGAGTSSCPGTTAIGEEAPHPETPRQRQTDELDESSPVITDPRPGRKRSYGDYEAGAASIDRGHPVSDFLDSQASTISDRAYELRATAWNSMISNALEQEYTPIGLLSTHDNHTTEEEILGATTEYRAGSPLLVLDSSDNV
jgi:hypothetical protein